MEVQDAKLLVPTDANVIKQDSYVKEYESNSDDLSSTPDSDEEINQTVGEVITYHSEEEDYFDIEVNSHLPKKIKSIKEVEKKESKNIVYQSVPVFESMHVTNQREGSRLNRAPSFKWENEESTPQSINEKRLRIYSCTWNLHGKKAPNDISQLVRTDIKHDIYAFGTEECMRSIQASLFYSSKEKWESQLREILGEDYIMIKSHTLQAIHLAIFVHRRIIHMIKDVESSHVTTGIQNIIGNKGAVGIGFNVGNTSFLFLNCHLAAGHDNVSRRNADFHRIEREMCLRRIKMLKRGDSQSSDSSDHKSLALGDSSQSSKTMRVSDLFDVVIWSGDFNYRVNGSFEEVIKNISSNSYDILLENDQLWHQKAIGAVATDYTEGKIEFAPTYKFKKNSDVYDGKKKRVPGWTDRILYKSRGDIMKQMSYDSVNTLKNSDHRAVFSQFLCNFTYEIPNNNPELDVSVSPFSKRTPTSKTSIAKANLSSKKISGSPSMKRPPATEKTSKTCTIM